MALDFQVDVTSNGRQIRFCNIVDEFIREALATTAASGPRLKSFSGLLWRGPGRLSWSRRRGARSFQSSIKARMRRVRSAPLAKLPR